MTQERFDEINAMSDSELDGLPKEEWKEYCEMMDEQTLKKEMQECAVILANACRVWLILGKTQEIQLVNLMQEDPVKASVLFDVVRFARSYEHSLKK